MSKGSDLYSAKMCWPKKKELIVLSGYGNKDIYNKLRDQFKKDTPGATGIIDLIR